LLLPILAFIVISTLVIFLLRLERRQSPGVTRSLWIPTIWMVYISSKPLSYWFPNSGSTPDTSPLDRFFLIILIIWAIAILIRRHFPLVKAAKENAWLMVLFGYMLVSLLWSGIPGTGFVRWVKEFQAVLMAFVLLSEPFPRQAMESIFRRTIYILIPYSLLLVKYFPEYGRDYGRWSGDEMWIGVTLQKNSLGRLCLISLFFLFWMWVKRRQKHETLVWKYLPYMEILLAATIIFLLRGPGGKVYSATAISALFAGFFVYAGLFFAKKRGRPVCVGFLLFLMTMILIAGILTPFTQGSAVGSLAPALGRSSTLTDRTVVWKSLVPVAMRRPLLGYGSGSFWTVQTKINFDISDGHSGYLDVLLNLGLIGILLVSIFLLSSCRKALREMSQDIDWALLWICCLIMSAVHNIAESSIQTFTSQFTAILLFLAVSSSAAAVFPENIPEKSPPDYA
jgi:exopolysaccharide production protein ExoQ